ncbi:stress responsive alpha/beta barrel protein [Sinobacterium caligoides]|uniref:Stress responsive alpha/beta barrel protein n=1 Tax=Sinobacterium caligoides TaxID=933926 RepID=A0A3N2DNJ5_9GAMM|nr:Dabb family protein [Sinobacterium caligoides]ROS01378.1 stress responsive alpha/beta barrel protein [Sinobacterium caligoides]
MSKRVRLYCLLLALLLGGSALSTLHAEQVKKTERVKTDQAKPVQHIVLLWLKDAGNPSGVAQVIAASHKLADIPGVDDLTVGPALPSERQLVDDSFDVAITMHFASPRAMDHYLASEPHRQIVAAEIKPLLSKIVVYDMTPQPATNRL